MKLALLMAAVAAAGTGCATASRAASPSIPACPAHAPNRVSRGLTTRHFVLPGASAMRICRYPGLNSADPLGLRQQRLIDSRFTIGRTTHLFNGLSVAARGIYNCPMDDGSELLVLFAHPHGGAERVLVNLSGCRFATNGRSSRWTTPRLQRRLLHLVKGR